jgi:MFS family permease
MSNLNEDALLNWRNIVLIGIVANVGPFLFGYEVGAMTWVILVFEDYGNSDDSEYNFYRFVADNDLMLGLVAGGAAFGAMLTYPFLLWYGNELAKKDEIMIAALLFFIGGFLISISGDLSWSDCSGLVVFMIGRLFLGAGIAASLHSIPQYVSEVVPSHVRGMLGAVTESMVMTGMVVGFGVAYACENTDGAWVATFAVFYCVSVLMGFIILLLPNSPVWMIHNDYPVEEIIHSLQFVDSNASEESVRKIKQIVENEKNMTIVRLTECEAKNSKAAKAQSGFLYFCGLHRFMTLELQVILHDRLLSRCLWLIIAFNIFRILVGQTFILYYATFIFGEIFGDDMESMIVLFMIVRMLTAYLMIYFGESLGRRDFMIWSCVLSTTAFLAAYLGFQFDITTLAALGIFLSGIAFEIGFGSIAYFLLPELVPFHIRSSSNAIGNFVLFACFFTINFLGNALLKVVGVVGLMICFFVINAMAAVYFHFYLPETRGVNIENSYLAVDEIFDATSAFCCCPVDDSYVYDARSSRYSHRGGIGGRGIDENSGDVVVMPPAESDSLLHHD